MYSQTGGRPAPGRGAKMQGRYIKGRLPEGVEFGTYPGRSSTPLPTAESKSAERINQLKIWNEAATNDDKRRLQTAKSKQALTAATSANRRTDSFKDARERHSASFQNQQQQGGTDTGAPEKRDIFADRSDEDDDDEDDDPPPPPQATHTDARSKAAPPPAPPQELRPMPAPTATAPPAPSLPLTTQQKQSNGCCTIQ